MHFENPVCRQADAESAEVRTEGPDACGQDADIHRRRFVSLKDEGQKTDFTYRFHRQGFAQSPFEREMIWSHPERVSGDLLIYDTRVPLSLLVQFLSESKIEEFEEAYPSVSKDKIIGILSHLARPSLKKAKQKFVDENFA